MPDVPSPKKQQSHTNAECDDNEQDAMSVENEKEKEDHEHEEEDKEDEKEEKGEEDDDGIEEIENGVSEDFGSKESVAKSSPPKVKRPQKNTKVVKKKGKTMEQIEPIHLKTSTHSGGTTIIPSNALGKGRSYKNIDRHENTKDNKK
ncbi:hypothetical protein BDL97_04G069900 [Sphagnum fallax]|nr:hypothetical protein BDL97_04G069900 [Sphagnum fallax]